METDDRDLGLKLRMKVARMVAEGCRLTMEVWGGN